MRGYLKIPSKADLPPLVDRGLVERVGERHDDSLDRRPVGFKRIDPSQIRGAWKPGKYGSADDVWIPNPHYVPR
ncbi:hypothetical protein GCM10012278_64220 [Nonomuraea glycinis]|uniref:Uncharacterized protein n=1 Tax=Nonomuraea glycinis TaxID=2047744 RepID=A0A918E8Q4_9ACTN|nr:hypothetical protein GCM10012278_64220 [Nonomuraea glycinis]